MLIPSAIAATRVFCLTIADRCVRGIEANRERSLSNLMRSSALATVFVPRLGYAEVSRLVRASVREQRPFIDLAIERGLLTQDDVIGALHDSTHQDDAPPASALGA